MMSDKVFVYTSSSRTVAGRLMRFGGGGGGIRLVSVWRLAKACDVEDIAAKGNRGPRKINVNEYDFVQLKNLLRT